MSTTLWPRRDSGPRARPGWGCFGVSIWGEPGSASRFSGVGPCTSAARSLNGCRPDTLEHAATATATEMPRRTIMGGTLLGDAAAPGLAWQREGLMKVYLAPTRRGPLERLSG